MCIILLQCIYAHGTHELRPIPLWMQEKIGSVTKHNSRIQEGVPVGGGGRGNITLIPSLPNAEQGSDIPSLMKLDFSGIGVKPSASGSSHSMMGLDGGAAMHHNFSWDEVTEVSQLYKI